MSKNEKNFSQLSKLEKIFRESAEEMAEQVLRDIQYKYETVIDQFYNHYMPLYYDRTLATLEGSSGAYDLFSPSNYQFNNDGYTVGITVDPSNIKTVNPYRADTSWVFNRTFVKGIHGINTRKGWGAAQTLSYRRLRGKYYTTYKVKLVPGTKYALKQEFTTRHYVGNMRMDMSQMTNMTPAPRSIMNKWWREEYNKRKNLDSIFSNILDSKLG